MNPLYKKAGLYITMCALLTSCVKHELLDFHVDKPESVIVQEDLDSYAPLISYINKDQHPNFKFGVALSLNDYVNKTVMYRLANLNFNEIVLGYEMKHGAIVQSDGSLNTTSIEQLIETAKAADMAIYGHTLAWHANQNASYLNSLIQPTIIPGQGSPTWDVVTSVDFETDDETNYQYTSNAIKSFTAVGDGANGEGRALKLINESERTNDYDFQFFLPFSPAVEEGDQYELTMDVRSDEEATYSTQAHTTPTNYKHWDFFGQITSTPQWTTITKTITVSADMASSGAIAFNMGTTATSYYFDNISLKKYNESGGGGGGDGGYAFRFTNPSVGDFWGAQIAYDLSDLQNDTEYTLKFVVKGSKAGTIRAEVQSTSDYSSDSFGTFGIGPEWKEYELKTTTNASNRNRFLFSYGDFDGTVFIDNVSLVREGSATNLIPNGDFESGADGWGGWGGSSSSGLSAHGEGYGGVGDQVIEKTPEEKEAIISAALETWIAGILEISKDHVKAWDVVNEPMSDWPDQYQLKTGVGKADMADDEFYWQDYLGKDYAVKAINLARKYGNPDDILFINDYGLEGGGDKTKGLIEFVDYIESQGAKVDGIGTQMHIDINTDKDNIAEMFRLLAATGKLIKVSELDVGIGVKIAQATSELYQKQADMYKYVIEKYFEIIPSAQHYGITIWGPLDSPADSFWRADEPIGLWTQQYVRKAAFQSVAEALEKQ